MHRVVENKNKTAHPLVAVAEREFEVSRKRLSQATGFQFLPLDEQVLYLLREPAMAGFSENELAEILAVMKHGNWMELANSATGVYAEKMSYDAEANTLAFSMRQKDEPDAGRYVTVSFTLNADGDGVVKVSVPEEPDDSGASSRKTPSGEKASPAEIGEAELGAWAERARELSRLSDEIGLLVSGGSLPQDAASPLLLDRVKAKMDAYETRPRKWGFGMKTEHVTRSYEDACAVVAAEGDGGARDEAGEYLRAIEAWLPVVQARRERTERDQAASMAFSKVAEALSEQGWSLETPDAGPDAAQA